MSRIGRLPVAIPAGVTVDIKEGNDVVVKGPKGTLERSFAPQMKIELSGAEVIVTRPDDRKENKALHGLTRALIHNMVVGVSQGFSKVESAVEGNKITVSGISKEKVGQYAAEIRGKRPPEPYKGKGIKYSDEIIRRKVGKTGKK